MRRRAKWLAWLTVPALLALGPGPARADDPDPNTVLREPVLHYDVTGVAWSTFVHRSLAVYSDGLVVCVEGNPTATPATSNRARARVKIVGPEETAQLLRELEQAGAFDLPDQWPAVMDTPTKTVTVYQGLGQDRLAHTYNYFIPMDDYAPVEDLLEGFLVAKFPASEPDGVGCHPPGAAPA